MKVRRGYLHRFGDICDYTWRSLFAHPWILIFLFVLNVAFVFVFSMYETPTSEKIKLAVSLLADIFSRIVQSTNTDVIFSEPIVQKLFLDMIWLFAILAVATYLIYTFFQSTSVRMVGWMILDKRPFSIWSFIKLNLLWYAFYLILRTCILTADLTYSFLSNSKAGAVGLSFLYDILHILLFYFLFISYTFLEDKKAWSAFKQSWTAGIYYFHYYLPNFAVFALYQIPVIYLGFFVPVLNLLLFLGPVGQAIQLAILFMAYTFIIANTFTITHEIARAGDYK